MKKTNLLLMMVGVLFFPFGACTGQEDTEQPTVIVIDAETGRPIEGAVALAQWHKSASLGLGMGAALNLVKAAEVFSDTKGQVFIEDFWVSNVFNWKNRRQPRLTIYKPGYVLWDSEEICPFGKRTDFDEKNRKVKLLKFEAEAARWLKEKYDKGRGGPRSMQNSFFYGCYSGEMGIKYKGQIKFQHIFHEYELPLLDKEKKK